MITIRPKSKAKLKANWWAWQVLLFLLATAPVFSQQRSLNISQYLHKSWTAQEGFFKPGVSGINFIAQTTDGYLWAPGPDFLLRFDGVRFYEWKPPNNEPLPDEPIHQLLGSKDGSLWIGGIGLAELKADGEFRRYHQLDGTEIEGLIEDKDGGIWAGGAGRPESPKLCRLYHGEATCFPADSFLGGWAGVLYEDGKGQTWACSNTGIWRVRPGPPLLLTPFSKLTPCRDLAEDGDGRMIMLDSGDLKMVAVDGQIVPYPLKVENALRLFRDKEGDLWITTDGHGIIHIHEGQVDRFTTRDGLSSDTASQIFADREGNLWAGTTVGLDKFTKPAVSSLTARQGLSNMAIASVLMDHQNRLWVGTDNGLDQLVDGHLVNSAAKFPNHDIKSIFQTSKGRMLVASVAERGLVWFDGDKTISIPTPSGEDVFGFTEGLRGDVWVASRALGLLHLREDGSLVESFPRSMLKRYGVAIAFDPKRDGLWITSLLGQLGFFKDGKFVEQYGPKDGLGEGVIRDPQVDDDGGVWASTRVGLAHLKNGRISVLGRKNGLPCDGVHWMRHDLDHNVWLYTECGLIALSENDLASWISDPSHAINILHYLGNTDGVDNFARDGWFTPRTATLSDGRILFIGDGLSILDPRHLNQNTVPPPVHIEEITADERTFAGSGRVSLPAKAHTVQIAFTALSFTAPWKVRFRYKLQGYDPDWSSPGALRQATYTNLPPGKYEFQVIACNNDGVWNMTGDSVSIYIPPTFYQTIWFRCLMVVVAACLLWLIYALRLRRVTTEISARLGERLQERERIARNLHDTLLQDFQVVILRFQSVTNRLTKGDANRPALEEGLDYADKVLAEGRNQIRDIRADTKALNELSESLAGYGNELSQLRSIAFSMSVTGTQFALDPAVRDEVYRIAREAIGNAFKHSNGSTVEVEIAYLAGELQLRIRDDGDGIDPVFLDAGRPGHWGVENMKARAEKIGASLIFSSHASAGTSLELKLPVRFARKMRA